MSFVTGMGLDEMLIFFPYNSLLFLTSINDPFRSREPPACKIHSLFSTNKYWKKLLFKSESYPERRVVISWFLMSKPGHHSVISETSSVIHSLHDKGPFKVPLSPAPHTMGRKPSQWMGRREHCWNSHCQLPKLPSEFLYLLHWTNSNTNHFFLPRTSTFKFHRP